MTDLVKSDISRANTKLVYIVLGLFLFLIFGYIVNKGLFFPSAETMLQTDSVGTGMLDYGTMGKILEDTGLVKTMPNDYERYPKTNEENPANLEIETFQKKRHVGDRIFRANTKGFYDFESTTIIDRNDFKKGWDVISIVAKKDDLYSSETGLFSNPEEHGREWERPVEVSFFDGHGVKFATTAGIRIHGGRRRLHQSFISQRLYFRDQYGVRHIPGKWLFSDGHVGSVRSLIIYNTDWPPGFPFNNPIAYEISNMIGAEAPDTHLVEVYLNGQSKGMAFITPHLSRRQLDERFGHSDYYYYRFKSHILNEDRQMYNERFWKVLQNKNDFSMETVSKSIDLDNFSKHIFSFIFNGTTDYCQGVAILDKRDPDAKLKWLNWDMDHSFYDRSAEANNIKRENWEQIALRLVYKEGKHRCGRAALFTRLINESEKYKHYFTDMVTSILNHKLTPEKLLSRVAYYRTMAENFRSPHAAYFNILDDFMRNRGQFVLDDMAKRLNLGKKLFCEIQMPSGVQYYVDGHEERGNYKGYYFNNQTITISVPEHFKQKLSHWEVNGEPIVKNDLSLNITRNISIEPFFLRK